ncbi:MAG TPA: hypothetical protein GX697_07225 [Firmicutes bacterium]|nr:hypothetical protein [Bacillota bacterium]
MKKNKKIPVENYAAGGLLAFVPVYREGGNACRIFTREGIFEDNRTVRWFLRRLAAYYGFEPATLRREYAGYLCRSHYISLPLSPRLVLLPLKMRQARIPGDSTLGYLNACEIAAVLKEKTEPPFRSSIHFNNGLVLPCLNCAATVRERLLEAELVLREYCRRQGGKSKGEGMIKPPQFEEEKGGFTCPLKDVLKNLLELVKKED